MINPQVRLFRLRLALKSYSLPPPRRITFSSFVCLLATLRKNFRKDLREMFREGWQWPSEQISKFRWRFGHRLDTGIVFRIRHYWEIQKVVNGHKSAAHTDSLAGDTCNACLGGGMRCPSVSTFL